MYTKLSNLQICYNQYIATAYQWFHANTNCEPVRVNMILIINIASYSFTCWVGVLLLIQLLSLMSELTQTHKTGKFTK